MVDRPFDVKLEIFKLEGIVIKSASSMLVCGLGYENLMYDIGRNGISVSRYRKLGSRSCRTRKLAVTKLSSNTPSQCLMAKCILVTPYACTYTLTNNSLLF